MKKEERFKEITHGFEFLSRNTCVEDPYVVFENPKTLKFVQFSLSSRGILCDIPLIELSKDEESGIRQIMEEEATMDSRTGEKISYQRVFEQDEIEQAFEMLEMVFTEVFKLPESYSLRTERGYLMQ